MLKFRPGCYTGVMNSKNIEIEIKVKIEKPEFLIKFLKKNGKLISETKQVDKYFVPKHRNFLKFRPAKEWLRLRNNGGTFSINYKNWHYGKDGKTNYCDEFETNIDDFIQVEKIFGALDIKTITVVDKKRQTWRYKNFEVAIDWVEGLGSFVEVEYKGKVAADPRKVTNQMVEFLKNAGCGRISRNYQGYPFLLLFPKEAKYEDQ